MKTLLKIITLTAHFLLTIYKIEITALKTKLKHVSPLIALLSLDKSKSLKSWEEEYNRINNKLDDIHFYQTTEIYLSYGNEDDKQKKSSWADGDRFYYVGDCFSPRILDGLVEPLGSFLNIRYAERNLNVLILDTFESGKEFLIEKGLDISLIPSKYLDTEEIAQGYSGHQIKPYNEIDEDLGRKGELAVFDFLKYYYQSQYNDMLIETSTGFKIGNQLEVVWRNKDSFTYANHDFLIIENGQEIYIDSKATPYGKNVEKLALYISGNELALMEHAEKYLIARVYNVTTSPVIEFVKLDLDTSLCL